MSMQQEIENGDTMKMYSHKKLHYSCFWKGKMKKFIRFFMFPLERCQICEMNVICPEKILCS